MKRFLFLALLFAGMVSAQNTVYLRYGAGNPVPITADTASVGSQVTITSTAHGFTNGQVVFCWNVQNDWAIDGTRKIANATTNTFQLTLLDGTTPVLKNGTFGAYGFVNLSGSTWTKTAYCAPTVAYSLTAPPNLWTDGPGGTITTQLLDAGSKAPRAVAGNPAWVGMQANISNNALDTNYAWDGTNFSPYFRGATFLPIAALALNWFSDHSQTNSLAAAKYWLGNPMAYIVQGMACNETVSSCGDITDSDYSMSWFPIPVAAAYSLLRGAGQMSAGDITLYDNMVNNTDQDGNTCNNVSYATGTGVLTDWNSSTGVLTGSGTTWNTAGAGQLHHGDILWNATWSIPEIVSSVTDDTHVVMSQGVILGFPGSFSGKSLSYLHASPWQTGQCGWLWWAKHAAESAMSPYAEYGPISNPGGGANGVMDPTDNHRLSFTAAAIALAGSTAYDDARGARNLEIAANVWNDLIFPVMVKQYWTGVTNGGDSQYFMDRFQEFPSLIAIMLKNLTGGSVDYTTGNWILNTKLYHLYEYLPNSSPSNNYAGVPFGISQTGSRNLTTSKSVHQPEWAIQPADPISQYFLYWNQNIGWWNSATSGGLGSTISNAFNYAFFDPTATATDYRSTLLTAHPFTTTDGAQVHGATNVIISRTGWTSPTDSLLWINGASIYSDANSHWDVAASGNYGPGTYYLYQNHYLIADDQGTGVDYVDACYAGITGDAAIHTNYLEIGGASHIALATGYNSWKTVAVPRYDDGGNGVNANKYMYAQLDTSGAYSSSVGVTRAVRHFLDFKGAARYVIVDDDVATSAGQMKRRFIHFPNNNQSLEGTTTLTQATNTITSFDTSGGALLLSQVLFPQATGFTYTDNVNGSYTGGQGQTFRVSACAGPSNGTTAANCDTTNTAAEIMVIHRPTMNQSETLAPITQIAATNFTVVQIDDPTAPVVAAIAQSNMLYNHVTFTTTHGTSAGRYLIAGIVPGTYNVLKNGAAFMTNVTVNANANTIFWDGAGAGTYDISNGTPTCAITTTTLPDGSVGASYSQTIATSNCTAPNTWSITSGVLPTGLTLNGSTGAITGTCSAAGTYNFTVQVVDSVPNTATANLHIVVNTPPTQHGKLYGAPRLRGKLIWK